MLARNRFCYSPVNQMKKYYREGTYDDCEAHRCVLFAYITPCVLVPLMTRHTYERILRSVYFREQCQCVLRSMCSATYTTSAIYTPIALHFNSTPHCPIPYSHDYIPTTIFPLLHYIWTELPTIYTSHYYVRTQLRTTIFQLSTPQYSTPYFYYYIA